MQVRFAIRAMVGLLVGGAGAATALASAAGDVPGWRRDGTGIFVDAKPAMAWAATTNVLWHVRTKQWSNASPMVLGDRVFICEEPNQLLCLALSDGALLWCATNRYIDALEPAEIGAWQESAKQAAAVAAKLNAEEKTIRDTAEKIKKSGGDAALSNRLAEAKAAAAPLREQLAPLKKYLTPSAHEVNGYATPTPTTDGKTVFALFGNGVAAAYTPEGGRLWIRDTGLRPHSGWGHSSSPLLAGTNVIVCMGERVLALAKSTGRASWEVQGRSGFGSPALATVEGQGVIVTPGGDLVSAAGKPLARGVLKLPWTSPIVNGDVVYGLDESGAAAIRLTSAVLTGGAPEKLWQKPIKKERYYASAVLTDGLLYTVGLDGHMSALDAVTGDLVWEKALKLGGTIYPSPCLAGGRLFVTSDTGKTVVLKPGREFDQLASNALATLRSTPVFVGSRMLVRSLDGLYCIGAGH